MGKCLYGNAVYMARREDKRCAPRQFVQWDRSRVAVKADAANACALHRLNEKKSYNKKRALAKLSKLFFLIKVISIIYFLSKT